MKNNLSKNAKAAILFCAAIIALSFSHSVVNDHDYQNTKMNISLQLPDEWQTKVKIEESDNQVVFRYLNPGSAPVFLLSINKISDDKWITIKEQIPACKLLSHKNGFIVYVEVTDKTKIKGDNNKDFQSVVAKINEVVKSYKES